MLVKEFVNADEIAKGLSPFNPEGVVIEAGRLMLRRIEDLLEMGESFSIETTLATRSYINLVRRAQEKGYVVHLLFFWLDSIELAKRRVADRVASGGHNIPLPVIERRYKAGLKNLFEIFMKEVDIWILFDNSLNKGERVAFGGRLLPTKIKDIVKFKRIKDMSESEIEGFINKVESGLVEAQHDMLVEKALYNRPVVISDGNGGVVEVSAKQLLN